MNPKNLKNPLLFNIPFHIPIIGLLDSLLIVEYFPLPEIIKPIHVQFRMVDPNDHIVQVAEPTACLLYCAIYESFELFVHFYWCITWWGFGEALLLYARRSVNLYYS